MMAWLGVLLLTLVGSVGVLFGTVMAITAWYLAENRWEACYGLGGILCGVYCIWLAWHFAPFVITLT